MASPNCLPILKWNLNINIDGDIKRDMPIVGFTAKGMIRQSMKEWLLNDYPDLAEVCINSPAPFLGGDKTIQLLRLCEVSPSCPIPVKLKAHTEPVINLYGSFNINASAAQKAGFSVSEYIPISMMMIPRIRVVLHLKENVHTMTQGTLDNLSMSITSAPHTITIRRATLDATIYLVPAKVDYLRIPDIVEMLPNEVLKSGEHTYYEVHKWLIEGALKYLKENSMSIEAIGGRSAHVVLADYSGPEEVGKCVIQRRIDEAQWSAVLNKLSKYSILKCNKELLDRYGGPSNGSSATKPKQMLSDW